MTISRVASGLLLLWCLFWIWLFTAPPLQPKLYQGKALVLAAGLVFAAVGVAGVILPPTRMRRVLYAYENGLPVRGVMTLRVERWTDSNDYIGLLLVEGGSKGRWEVRLSAPSWPVDAVEGKEVGSQV